MNLNKLKLLKRRLVYVRSKIYCYIKHVKIGKETYLGRNVKISKSSTIGSFGYIGEYSTFHQTVHIGNYCLISDLVSIIGNDHNFNIPGKPIIKSGIPVPKVTYIGDDVWIGHMVSLKSGVTIGDGSIVGSNSVVTKNIPEYEIWAGVPAIKIGDRFESEDSLIRHKEFLNSKKH
ncbi:DapH/DapD/GlmU-related protein [Vibrio breoganii]